MYLLEVDDLVYYKYVSHPLHELEEVEFYKMKIKSSGKASKNVSTCIEACKFQKRASFSFLPSTGIMMISSKRPKKESVDLTVSAKPCCLT